MHIECPATGAHTHEDIDLVFGILLANVLRRYRVQCPEELSTMIEVGMSEWAAKYGLDAIAQFGP